MRSVRWAKVRSAARELLLRHNALSVPVDVARIAQNEGVRVEFTDLEDDVSGLLIRHRVPPVIGVNGNHHPVRQRFTVAHELGHLKLHNDQLHLDKKVAFRNAESSRGTQPDEVEANLFAAELLMPEELLMGELRRHGSLDESNIEEMARAFGVSTQAMAIRLSQLKLATYW